MSNALARDTKSSSPTRRAGGVPPPARSQETYQYLDGSLGAGILTAAAIGRQLVWIKPLDQFVAYYCAHGARIDRVRDPAAQEHVEALSAFVPMA